MRVLALVWPTLRDEAGRPDALARWEALLDRLDDLSPRIEALETTMKAEMDEILGSRATYVLLFAGVAAFLLGCAMAGWGLWSRGAA